MLLRSGLFDAEWYGKTYPDVTASEADPLRHFLQHGSYEDRSPGPGFDTMAYLRRNPDVFDARREAVFHYLEHGRKEGRLPS